MIGSCIFRSIFQLRHCENGSSDLKSFDGAGIYSYDTKVSLPSQKGWAWVQLLPYQKLSNSEIVCHLAERDDPQNSAKNHENV